MNNKSVFLNPHYNQDENKQVAKAQNFQIYLRIKPRLTQTNDTEDIIKKIDNQKLEIVSPYYIDNQKGFQYDHIFQGQISNQLLFQKTMTMPINNVLNGFNSTILIYGMTGAGKTYTMFGDMNNTQNSDGIIFLTLSNLFQIIRKQSNQYKTKLTLSFYQIYNQTIRDLLKENSTNLNIQQDPYKGVIVQDLTQFVLQSEAPAKSFIFEGLQRRAMNATKSNQVSSRSHAIFQLNIKRFQQNAQNMNEEKCKMFQSKLFLIDLAGNQKSYTNCNKRFVEGVNINKSLLTLGKCISILAQQKKNQFVPFRDSKLTRILKQSLGGNAKTVMIACISSSKKYYEQTLNTLKYSSIAKNIKNKSSKNVKQVNKSEFIGKNQFVNLKTQRSGNEDDLFQQKFPILNDILKIFIKNVQQKQKIQYLIKNLKTSKVQNQQLLYRRGINDPKIKQTIKQIDNILLEMEKERIKNNEQNQKNYKIFLHELTKQKNDNNGNDFIKTIKQQKKTIQIYRKQIQYHKKIIQEKDIIIEKLKSNQNQMSIKQEKQSDNDLKIIQNQPNSQVKDNIFNIKKQISNQNKVIKLSTTTQPSLSLNKRNSTKKIDISLNPVNLTKQNLKQQNIYPQIDRVNLKHYLDKKPKQIMIDLNSNSQGRKTKQQFVQQLKQVQKNIRDPKMQKQIQKLIVIQQINQFQLNANDLSILRKLKLVQQRHNESILSNSSQKNILNTLTNNTKDLKRSFSRKMINKGTLK